MDKGKCCLQGSGAGPSGFARASPNMSPLRACALLQEEFNDRTATLWKRVNPGTMKSYLGLPKSTSHDLHCAHPEDSNKDWHEARRAERHCGAFPGPAGWTRVPTRFP